MKSKIVAASLAVIVLAACSPREPAETPASSEAASEAAVSSLAPADYTSLANVMTCDWPVKKTDTAESLLATYKSYAQVTDIPGENGIKEKGVLIYANDPRRRVEVRFADDALTQVAAVRIRNDSQWSGPGGLHIGDTVADIVLVNKKAFTINGFAYDDGGRVRDWQHGKLAHVKGGCYFGLALGFMKDHALLSDTLLTEHQTDSSDQELINAAPVVKELYVAFSPDRRVEGNTDQ